MWQSARYGLRGNLINFVTTDSVPAHAQVEALLNYIQPAQEHYGDWAYVSQQVATL